MATTLISELAMPVARRDHVRGRGHAAVTLLEYGDYECPYCGQAYHIIKRILDELGGEVRFVFRNFPLAQIHPHAFSAALAAESAGFQGQFWGMHDLLFEHQDALEFEDIVTYATFLEVELEKFTADMDSEAAEQRVEQDIDSGIRSGVIGTPTFFINGKRHNLVYDYATLKAALQEAIGEARA